MTLCPCCSQKNYDDCCGPYIQNISLPNSPEALMRSRYTAYTQANLDYIARTMKGRAATHFDLAETKEFAEDVTWDGLTVIAAHQQNDHGAVEFIAKYHYRGNAQTLHERSEFIFETDRWFYVDGANMLANKIGRNDPCPCGSGEKYKKCCG